ncbi:MAG: extracellular solute-binding protein, partial [Gemmatimonadota bacterium]
LDTPQMRASLTMVRSLVQAGAAGLERERDDGCAAFGRGQALFAMQSSAQAPQFAAAVEQGASFAWGMAPVPYEGDHPVQNVYGASLAVCASTPAKQLAAWLFIKWFTQPEQQDRWVTSSLYFPVRRSIAHRLSSYYRASYELLDFGKPEPAIGGYEPVRTLMVETMQRVVGGADMPTELRQLERQATATIQAFE